MNLSRVRSLHKKTKLYNGIFQDNPVLRFGLALPFAVAGATTLKSAIALTIAMFVAVVPISMLAYEVGDKIPRQIRLSLYPFLGVVLMLPVRYFLYKIDAVLAESLGMYIFLIGASSLLISQVEHSGKRKRSRTHSLIKSSTTCLGFGIIISIMGVSREIMGSGTVWGKAMPLKNMALSGVTYTFFGFIVLGFIMAAAKAFKRSVNAHLLKPVPKEN